MAVFGGILKGMNENVQQRLAEDQVTLREQQEARLQKSTDLDDAIKKVSLVNTIGGSTKTTGSKTTKTSAADTENYSANMAQLVGQFSIPEEQVKKIASEGGASSISELLKIAKGLKLKLAEGNYVGQSENTYDTLIGELIANRVVTAETSTPVDLSKFASALGPELLEELNLLGITTTVPGSSSFDESDVVLVERISLTDLNLINDGAAKDLISQASGEMNKLMAVTQAEIGTVPQEVSLWAAQRQGVVGAASRDAKATNKDLSGVLKLYGGDYFNRMAMRDSGFDPSTDVPTYMYELSMQKPAIEIRSSDPTSTSSGNLYLDLLDTYNILQQGQMVMVWNEEEQTYYYGPAGGDLVRGE